MSLSTLHHSPVNLGELPRPEPQTDAFILSRGLAGELNQFRVSASLGKAVDATHKFGLSQRDFSRLYNPLLPTVAILYPNCDPGASLLGLACSLFPQLRIKMNVVYVPNIEAGALSLDDKGYIRAHVGFVVDEKGRDLVGQFPYPPVIKLLVNASQADDQISELVSHSRTGILNPPKSSSAGMDKVEAYEALATREVLIPDYQVLPAHMTFQEVQVAVTQFLNRCRAGTVVVKPPNARCSQMVSIIDSTDVRGIIRDIQKVRAGYGRAILETFVEPWPMRDPKEPLHHSLRLYCLDGVLIDVFARINKPFSLVSLAKGADYIHMRDFLGKMSNPKPFTFATMYARFRELAKHSLELFGPGVVALDAIISDQGRLVVHDVNRKFVVGLKEGAFFRSMGISGRLFAHRMYLETISLRPEMRV